jgi:predicted DNA-binding antitoxin AbrB/MazE fold protein
MTQEVEAVYSDGVLKPARHLALRDQQRVRLTVETIDDTSGQDRTAAAARLRAGIAQMQFYSEGRLPTRDQLHGRD